MEYDKADLGRVELSRIFLTFMFNICLPYWWDKSPYLMKMYHNWLNPAINMEEGKGHKLYTIDDYILHVFIIY